MPAERFIDTDILIYAFAANDARSAQAEAELAIGGVISVQVLNEFTNVARRQLAWDWAQIEASLDAIDEILGKAMPLTVGIHARAVEIARDHTLTFYDALIVAAALEARCHLLLSEDMQHGQQLGDLTIHNPFR